MSDNSTSFGYKGKGGSSSDVTALRKKVAEARLYNSTLKTRGALKVNEIKQFKISFNTYSTVTHSTLSS
jgi:hypothetical protein